MPKLKKKKRRRLSPEEQTLRRNQRQFRNRIQHVFDTAGFDSIATRDKHIVFRGREGEFDALYVFENIVVVMEDTCAASSDKIYEHLLKKNQFYEHLENHRVEFLEFLAETYSDFSPLKHAKFEASELKLVTLYCSKHRIEERHKERFPNLLFLEERHLRYFRALTGTLGRSIRFELFKFFRLNTRDVGVSTGIATKKYEGFVLPESPSGFPRGYRIATFYVDPETLISLSYVLRKDGWRDSEGLYQRMIGRAKIRSMRRYLAQSARVFINNVIVSLPSTTKLLDRRGNQLSHDSIDKTTPVQVEIELEFNSVGLIDGQHRVFAYHEGQDAFDAVIAPKRKKQQLLVTGVIYPANLDEDKQRGFEARLFLEINDKQTRTKADLRQAIEAIVNPYSVIAISRAVVNRLAGNGPLCGYLEEDQFDIGKLKTTSIVSYGLRHIIKPDGDDALFKIWRNPEKEDVRAGISAASNEERITAVPSRAALDDYIMFCAREVNRLLSAYRRIIPSELWTLDRKISRALTTTAINGLVFCLRRLIEENRTASSPDEYVVGLSKLDIQFTPSGFKYKSSHWRELGERIARTFL